MSNNNQHKMPNYKVKYFNTSLLMMGEVLSVNVSNLDKPTIKALVDFPKYKYFPMSVEFNKIFDFIESYSNIYKHTLQKSLRGDEWTISETITIFDDLLPKFIKYGIELFDNFRFKDFAKMVLTTNDADIRHFIRLVRGLMKKFYYQDSFLPSFNLINKMSEFIWFFQLLQEFETNDFSSYSSILVKEMKYVGKLFIEFEKQMSFISKENIQDIPYIDSKKYIALISNFLLKINSYLLGLDDSDDYQNKEFMFDLDFWREPSFFYEGILESNDLEHDINNITSILKQNNTTVFLCYYRELQMIRTILLSYLKRFDTKEPLYLANIVDQVDFDDKFSKVLDILIEKCFYFNEYKFIEASTKETPIYKIDLREAIVDHNGFSMVFKAKNSIETLYELQKAIDTFWGYSDAYGFDRSLFASINKLICANKKYASKLSIDEDLQGAYFHSTKNILIYLEIFGNLFYPIYENWERYAFHVQPNYLRVDQQGIQWVFDPSNQSFYARDLQILKYLEYALIHEIGHYFYFVVMNDSERDLWTSSGWFFDSVNQKYAKKLDDFEYVSLYATKDPFEDFAETFFIVLSNGNPTNQQMLIAFQRFEQVVALIKQRLRSLIKRNPSKASVFDTVNSYLNGYLNTTKIKIEDVVDFRPWEDDLASQDNILNDGNFYFEGVPNELVFDYRPTFITFVKPNFEKRSDTTQKTKELLELSINLLILSYVKLYGIEPFKKIVNVYGYSSKDNIEPLIEDITKQITSEMINNRFTESNQKMFVNICRTLFDMFVEISFI